jgi:UDP-2,3-diacylglucosamine pyrophosphatase LpxH
VQNFAKLLNIMEKRTVDAVVISDVHLGTFGCKAKELLNYLKSISPGLLILNGDIIDVWQFSKRYFPASHLAVLKEIIHLAGNGTRVFYITGNHDELLRKYSDIQIGNFTLTDKIVLEMDEKLTWIFHGDVFDNTTKGAAKFLAKLGSTGYAFLILINKAINFCMKVVGKEKISFSKAIMNQVNRAVTKVNDFEQTAAEIAIEKKYQYVICGHIHKPQIREVVTEKGRVTYLNSGDWVEHMTSLEYNKHEWSIYEHEHSQTFDRSKDKTTQAPLSVITEEISFYIHSLTL